MPGDAGRSLPASQDGETMAPQHVWSPTVCLGYPCLRQSTDAQGMSLSHTTDEDTDTLRA